MRLFLDLLALIRALSTLRRVLREYVEYYNESRCHMALDGDAPEPRDKELGDGPVIAKPILGGLHHSYSRAA